MCLLCDAVTRLNIILCTEGAQPQGGAHAALHFLLNVSFAAVHVLTAAAGLT